MAERAERTIYISEYDFERLEQLIEASTLQKTKRDSGHLRDLELELERARIVPAREVPAGVVTMNSKLRIVDADSGERTLLTLVFPQDADIDAGKISVLSPVGTALLGYRTGDTIEWPVPAGLKRIWIEEVLYRPEAAGDFHL